MASKLDHAVRWQNLCINPQWNDFNITSSWIDDPRLDNEMILSKEVLAKGWTKNIDDLLHADVCVVYAALGDNLRGALVEAGAALAFGIPVIAVGYTTGTIYNRVWGSWQYHPLVTRVKSLHEVPSAIRNLELIIAGG